MNSKLKPMGGVYKVKMRRNLLDDKGKHRPVSAHCEWLDGRQFKFKVAWLMDEEDKYPGEYAMQFDVWPGGDAPAWISFNDLEFQYEAY